MFHYAQIILKKMKYLNIIKNKMNKRAYEILRNLELLCFVDKKNIIPIFNYFKENIFTNEN